MKTAMHIFTLALLLMMAVTQVHAQTDSFPSVLSPSTEVDSGVDVESAADTIFIYADNTLTEAEMNSTMMTDTRMVEAGRSFIDRMWDLLWDHYVIAPMLMLAIVAGIFRLVGFIHRKTL